MQGMEAGDHVIHGKKDNRLYQASSQGG
jgi:hypothetical protein